MADDSVGYFHNVQKWRGSRSVQRMSFAERGVYREMLDEQWDHGPLPDDPAKVAELIAITPDQIAEVVAAWPVVRPKFLSSERKPGVIYNAKLEDTRREQRAYYRKRREAGSEGGKAKARNRQTQLEMQAKQNLAELESASGVSSTALAHSTERKGKEGIGKDRTGMEKKERPVFQSARFDLFQWQIDALQKQVGTAYDVPDFLHQLSERTTQVMPPREAIWPWLQQQAVAEARRRGVAVAEPTRAGKLTTNLAAAIQNIAAREGR